MSKKCGSIELWCLKINRSTNDINICICYTAPNSKTNNDVEWRKIIDTIETKLKSFFLVGELNTHNLARNCSKTETNGKYLLDILNKKNSFLHDEHMQTHNGDHGKAHCN